MRLKGTITSSRPPSSASVPKPQAPLPSPLSPPRGTLLTWGLDPVWQVPSTWRETSNHCREKLPACLSRSLLFSENHADSLGFPVMGFCNYDPFPLDLFIPETSSQGPSVQAQEVSQTWALP